MPLFRDRPLRIQPYFGFRSERRLHLQARALQSGGQTFAPAGRWQAMRTMLAQYLSHEVAGARVRLEIATPLGEVLTSEATSDAEGFVDFTLELGHGWDLPLSPTWEVAQLHWTNCEGEQSLPAHILAPARQGALGIISDIDDTIIETGITGNIIAIARNWQRILAQWPEERIAVPGSDAFFNALGGGVTQDAPVQPGAELPLATNRPLFYVSSSPWNLFPYLVAFKRAKGLPLGPLLLRDWGLNRRTLGSGSHGGHKAKAIERILTTYPDMRFALIGDDTQRDLYAFADAAGNHANRIAAIFIRQVGSRDLSADETAAVAAIKSRDVPLWMGQSYTAGHAFLRALGLEDDGPVGSIVDATGDGGGASAAKSSVPVHGQER